MSIDIFFNELSISQFASIELAKAGMKTFISTSIAYTKNGARRGIRSSSDMHYLTIAPEYTIANWRNDPDVSREEKTYYRSLSTKFPVFDGLPAIQDQANEFECKHNDISSPGLLATYLMDCACISLLTNECWNISYITAQLLSLNSEGNTEQSEIILRNSAAPNQVSEHHQWISERNSGVVSNGNKFVNFAAEIFTNLDFTETSFSFIKDLTGSESRFQQTVKKIGQLNKIVGEWTEGAFPYISVPFKISPESESTLNSFSTERTYLCPDGQQRLFSDHFRLCDGWRVHIRIIDETRRVLIGYIGPHLRTARFRN